MKRSTSTVKDWLQITALNIKSIFQPRPDPAQDRLINLFAQSRRRPRLINSVNSRDNLLNGKILCWYSYTYIYIYSSSTWYLVNYCIVDSKNLCIRCSDVNNNMLFWSQSLFFRAMVKYTICRSIRAIHYKFWMCCVVGDGNDDVRMSEIVLTENWNH